MKGGETIDENRKGQRGSTTCACITNAEGKTVNGKRSHEECSARCDLLQEPEKKRGEGHGRGGGRKVKEEIKKEPLHCPFIM